MKNVFLAISSDYRELYKADIYKILAKPIDAIEHFRYQKKWISDDCTDIKTLKNKEVILIFKHVEKDKPSIYIPIRKAIIVDFFHDPDTETYHYYFKLAEFCKIKTNLITYNDSLFFLKQNNLDFSIDTWKNKVEEVKTYFNDMFFYKIDGILDNKGNELKLTHDKTSHSYYYNFIHGESYTLNLTVSNSTDSKNSLTIKASSSDINVILTDKYYISVPYDKLKIPITTKSLDTFKEKSFISFYINNKEDKIIKEYENHIHILKKMSLSKPIWFGILSSILIACTWLLKDKTSSIENIFSKNDPVDWLTLCYVFSILISSSFLYALFNKK